jgi:hypothetical protein
MHVAWRAADAQERLPEALGQMLGRRHPGMAKAAE